MCNKVFGCNRQLLKATKKFISTIVYDIRKDVIARNIIIRFYYNNYKIIFIRYMRNKYLLMHKITCNNIY